MPGGIYDDIDGPRPRERWRDAAARADAVREAGTEGAVSCEEVDGWLDGEESGDANGWRQGERR